MELIVNPLEIEAGGPLIVVINRCDADNLGIIGSDRVYVKHNDKHAICIVNITTTSFSGTIGTFREVTKRLQVSPGDQVQIEPARRPESLEFIREKINGQRLSPWKIQRIVGDVVERHLSDIELTSFVTALHINGVSMEEVEALSRTMVWSGKSIHFDRKPILDKHSIGGIPGDKTTLVLTPIIAASGYTIPKSSSRAITSPAGTADRMEVLAPVELNFEEIKEIVNKVGACIVWGGAIDLAPADDLFIRVEYPLSIDPLLLPSIMSKKKAMGSTHVIIDIPVGPTTKITTINDAEQLASDFIELGRRFDMQIECAVTEGSQPIGYNIGPLLEAQEALYALHYKGSHELVNKATNLAGILFEMVGNNNGKQMALDLIKKGKALEKMKDIIEAQGGNPEIKPEELVPGDKTYDVLAPKNGKVLWFQNRELVKIARAAGAPSDKKSGIKLFAKMGDKIKEGDLLYRVHSESSTKLDNAIKLIESLNPIDIGKKVGEDMLRKHIGRPTTRSREFIIDR